MHDDNIPKNAKKRQPTENQMNIKIEIPYKLIGAQFLHQRKTFNVNVCCS